MWIINCGIVLVVGIVCLVGVVKLIVVLVYDFKDICFGIIFFFFKVYDYLCKIFDM